VKGWRDAAYARGRVMHSIAQFNKSKLAS